MKGLNFNTKAIRRERNASVPQQPKQCKQVSIVSWRKSRFGWYSKRGKSCWAYYAVCGNSNFYKKFGLRLSDADLHKWQEHSKAAAAKGEETEQHETKAHNCFALSVAGASESHGRDIEMAVVRNVTGFHPALDLSERAVHVHSPFHSHHSHSHSSHGNGHYDWFFMSHWNMVGMNPYAVYVANHKAGKISVEHVKPKVSKSPGKNKVHSWNSHHSGSPVSAAVHSSNHKTKSGQDRMQKPMVSVFEAFNRLEHEAMRKTKKHSIVAIDNPVRYSVNRNNPLLKENPGKMRAKTNAVRSLVITNDPAPKAKSLNPVNYPRPETMGPGAPSRQGCPTTLRTEIAEQFRLSPNTSHSTTHDPRPIGYIPSRLPQKIISKLVVGAEALPE